jgi:hypothetical protein
LPDAVVGRDSYLKSKKPTQPSLVPYVRQAKMGKGLVEGVVDRILGTPAGHGRHFALNKAGYTLGGAVAGGAIGFETTLDRIVQAAITVGITPSEAERIGRRSMEDGMMEPMELSDHRDNLAMVRPVVMGSMVKKMRDPEPCDLPALADIIDDPMRHYVDKILAMKDEAMAGYFGRGKKHNPVELHWFAVCQHVDHGESVLLDYLPEYAAMLFGEAAFKYENTRPRSDVQRMACKLIMETEA